MTPDELTSETTKPIRDALQAWAAESAERIVWPELPPEIQDRNADVWEALVAVADLAGGDWPKRARVAAVAQVADSMAGAPSIGVQLLSDLKAVFKGRASMWAESILAALHAMDERPWNDLRGKPVDNRWLARQLKKYGVTSKDVKLDGTNKKGYTAEDLFDPWTRYVADVAGAFWKLGDDDEDSTNSAVGVAAQESATSATSATDTPAQCSVCSQPFLLPLPGKTICAIRDDDHIAARALVGAR